MLNSTIKAQLVCLPLFLLNRTIKLQLVMLAFNYIHMALNNHINKMHLLHLDYEHKLSSHLSELILMY